MKKLVVIHYFPIERYPPILNFLRSLKKGETALDTSVISSKNKDKVIIQEPEINYKRVTHPFQDSKFPLFSYWAFTFITLVNLIVKRPQRILYYETVSSLATLIYLKLFNKKCKLYIHFHEYTSTKEYLKQNFFWKWVYRLEQSFYKKAAWISHTNENRMQLFLKDNNLTNNEVNARICPNYPPAEWFKYKAAKVSKKGEKIKLIYVGYAVDKESTYINELVEWLSYQNVLCKLDIYCFKKESLSDELLGVSENVEVEVFDPIPYFDLPTVLSNYDVGLILYRGLSENYRHNAPNKLFEYLACGLDVWFPSVMTEPRKYLSMIRPKVLEINFDKLQEYKIEELVADSTTKREIEFFAENVYQPLLEHIVK